MNKIPNNVFKNILILRNHIFTKIIYQGFTKIHINYNIPKKVELLLKKGLFLF